MSRSGHLQDVSRTLVLILKRRVVSLLADYAPLRVSCPFTLVHQIGPHIGRQSLSPIFPLIISSAKYPPVSNWSNRPSYLRGRQQLFMGVLFVHWAHFLVRITLWAGWAPSTTLWIRIPSWSAPVERYKGTAFGVIFIEEQQWMSGVV